MGFLDKFLDKEKTSKVTIVDPKETFKNLLKQTSGVNYVRELDFDIFYQVYAFKGVVDGVGCSTIVANTALAIANLGLTVCVIDTSILQPVQDVLLRTNYDSVDKERRLDWFDMPYTKLSPLHVSSIDRNISVLSFYGKNRGIVDILSTNDNSSLVDMALTELHNKFDIILIDCCHELTSINTACLQQSQQVIQVWNDTPSIINNVDNFITNCVTLSCPLDKMRFVVYSKINPDAMGSLDGMLQQYRLKKLTTINLSLAVSLVLVTGNPLWQYASRDKDVMGYTDSIIDIACHICNITRGSESRGGTITSNEIMDGKVEGTLTKKMLNKSEELSFINRNPLNSESTELNGVHPSYSVELNGMDEDLGVFSSTDSTDGGE